MTPAVFKHLVSQSYVVRMLRGPSVSSKAERIYLQRKGEGEGKGREEKRREEERRGEKRREEKRQDKTRLPSEAARLSKIVVSKFVFECPHLGLTQAEFTREIESSKMGDKATLALSQLT